MTVDFCTAYEYAHALFDDLDLDAIISQWVGRGKKLSLNDVDIKASNKHNNGSLFFFLFFYMTLTLKIFIRLDQLVLSSSFFRDILHALDSWRPFLEPLWWVVYLRPISLRHCTTCGHK